ncbi:hypothetical protein AXI71_gp07 [Lactococcus phage GE1]|uniref:Uncharacterized protein n=1 Tax=Lactococcus phage GE1 TaxID=1698369 RepID=A0A0N9BAT2_9CAUD|nr:hypothetical protein AXI71_gp07 [Lactococcus phage GE1]ALA06961.1 hypothetical protein [Lactococcus phage GE1]
MILKDAVYMTAMLSPTEEFDINMENSLDLVNHMAGTEYTLDMDIKDLKHSHRIIDFIAIDIKRNMSIFEAIGTAASNVQMARDNKLVALEALFNTEEV